MDLRLEAFLKELLQKAHNTPLPEVLEEKMIADLAIQLESRLQQTILEVLPEEDHIEYVNLTQGTQNADQVNAFLLARIPDLQERLGKATQDFAEEYLAVVTQQ